MDVDSGDDVGALFCRAMLGPGMVIASNHTAIEENHGPVGDVNGVDDEIITDQVNHLAYILRIKKLLDKINMVSKDAAGFYASEKGYI